MKKLFQLLMVFTICTTLFINYKTDINAVGSTGGSSTVTQSQNFDVTVYVSFNGVKSGSISVNTDGNLQIVSGKWNLSGTTLSSFDGKDGSFAFTEERNISGAYFTVTLKALNITSSANVYFSGQLKNISGTVIGSVQTSKTVKVICANHSYSDWTTVNATCTNNGSKTRTCSVCGTVDTQAIPAKGHSVAQFSTTKEANCTETGNASGVCSVCGQTVNKTLPAKGHYFGEWVAITEATCTQHGTESRTCKDCGHSEERQTELAEHTLGNEYEVLYEATIAQYGLLEGNCAVCGTKFQKVQPCTYKIEERNITFECEEGCFAADTLIAVEDTDLNAQENANRFDGIDAISSKYTVYDINASLNERPVKPNGNVDVTLPLPEGYSNNTAIILIKEDGSTKILSSSVEEGMIYTQINEFGTYGLVDLEVYSATTANKLAQYENQQQSDKMIKIALASGCGVLAVGLVCSLVLKKKKKIDD